MKFFGLILTLVSFVSQAQNLAGSWLNKQNDQMTKILATENYITITEYTIKEFGKTWGGKYELSKNGSIYISVEFDSENPGRVNTQQTFQAKLKKDQVDFNGKNFHRINAKGQNALSGLWVITGRANEKGQISTITPGARRTYKMMHDGQFQWFAINTQTGEFFGTGGGDYTLINGKYTENIAFFSRDNSRVGSTLSFDALVVGNTWTHSGKSSKGDPLKEIWTKQ